MAISITLGARGWIERLWAGIADRGEAYATVPGASIPPLERARLLAASLLTGRGEASGAAVARELLAALRDLDTGDRASFRHYLATNFAPDRDKLREAAEGYLADPTPACAMRLFERAEPPRQELLRRINMGPGGTAALVEMRREMLGELKAEPTLKTLDGDLQHLFSSWFNRGFLELRRIDWDTPAAILEKLITYEAVHEIAGWEDLRRRLAPDRRCFAFFHRALPGEPLIFVEVALVRGLAGAIQPLLAPAPPDSAPQPEAGFDTAIFYSISNCQEGLRGVSFGNFLIKQVVEELKAELPQLTGFSTLSPVPGFRRWLERRLAREAAAGHVEAFRPDELDALAALVPALPAGKATAGEGTPADSPPADAAAPRPVATLSAATAGSWWEDPARVEALRRPLLRLCAEYLTRPNTGMGNVDPVARFHLGNGARLERVNWLGNTGPRGMKESFGVMVNYLYDPEAIEANHEAFVRDGAIARSAVVDAMQSLPRVVPAAAPAPRPSRRVIPRLLGVSDAGGDKPG